MRSVERHQRARRTWLGEGRRIGLDHVLPFRAADVEAVLAAARARLGLVALSLSCFVEDADPQLLKEPAAHLHLLRHALALPLKEMSDTNVCGCS